MRRKVFTLLLALAMVLSYSVPALNPAAEVDAATSKTVDQAMAWVQSQVGKGINYDGAYGNQCVDLIMAYYNALGVSPVSGNGKDYATNALPAGWSRVAGGTPQRGDILVYNASSGNPYGHVAIYESDYGTYHQNYNSHAYVEKVTNVRYNGFSNSYWGYIRPNWTNNNNPIGHLDSASGGTGTITVRGWAFDPDAKSTSIAVHVYIGGPAGSAGAEGHAISANKSRTDVNNAYGITGNHGFEATIATSKTGSQPIYVYAINTPSGNNPQIATTTVNIAKDTTRPVVSDVRVTNITSSGYTVTCTVTDTGSGVNRVQFPTWTEKGGQDDLVSNWTTNGSITGIKNGNTYTFTVRTSAHNNESGTYFTDIYAWDNAGNESGLASRKVITVPCAVHGSTQTRNAKAATCTEDGYTGDKYCTVCGAMVSSGNVIPAPGHNWDDGVETKAATQTEEGVRTYTCTVCGATKEEAIPKLEPTPSTDPTPGGDSGSGTPSSGGNPAPGTNLNQKGTDGTAVGPGASAAAAHAAIIGMPNDNDPAGALFGLLKAKSTRQTKTSVTVSWTKVAGASKYVIYGNACGKKNKMQKIAEATGKSKTFKSVAGKKVKKGTYYKFIIVALDKNNNVVSTSKIIHAATKGGKVGNDKSVKVSSSVIKKAKSLKKGKTLKLKAKAVKANLKVKRHRAVSYESSNPKIATVSKKGVVKGKSKGSCYVYAYAQNGVSKKIKVVVK